MSIFRMVMKEAGGRFQNAAGSIDSNKNMYAGAKGCAPSDKLAGGMSGGLGGISGGGAGLAMGGTGAGAGTSGMGAGDASSGVDFSSMGEAASAMA